MIIQTINLTKRYGKLVALNNLHLEIAASIVVTLPSDRFKPQRRRFIEPKLRRAAAEVSRQLGFDAEIRGSAGESVEKRKAV